MAEIISQELTDKDCEVTLKSVSETEPDELLGYDGIIIGSPTYYGGLAAQIKELFDKSVTFHGRLDGKIGAAFSSAANTAGGNETTVLSILNAMLIHGMIVQGDFSGDHYGPVAIGKVDKRAEDNCRRSAQRFSYLLSRIG